MTVEKLRWFHTRCCYNYKEEEKKNKKKTKYIFHIISSKILFCLTLLQPKSDIICFRIRREWREFVHDSSISSTQGIEARCTSCSNQHRMVGFLHAGCLSLTMLQHKITCIISSTLSKLSLLQRLTYA